MKGYIATETFGVGGSGWYQVLKGTLYIPDAQLELRTGVTPEVRSLGWEFEGTRNVGRHKLREVELNDDQVGAILEKMEQQRKAGSDLISTINELYSIIN